MARILVTGGTRSGKSGYAESRLPGPAVYVATGPEPDGSDAEWAQRVAAHRSRRPADWTTVATTDLTGLLNADGDPPLLIDSLGTWLTAQLAETGAFAEPMAAGARAAWGRRLDDLAAAWARPGRSAVLVTEEVGWGVHPPTRIGRLFADELGALNTRLAATADEVWLVACGMPLRLDRRDAAGAGTGR